MHVSFVTPGLIDLESAFTFGMSVKTGEKPIGFFGTGLKYAVATLLRTGHKIRIFEGTKERILSLQEKDHRGRQFDVVCLDGSPLGFTTELGRLWQVWMAFRELHSNTLDEGGTTEGKEVEPCEGYTTIRIEGTDFHQTYLNKGLIFVEGEPIGCSSGLRIFQGGGKDVFYRGVKASTMESPMLFSYSIEEELALTEDRTIKDPWMAKHFIQRSIAKLEDTKLLDRILTAPKGSLEQKFDYTYFENECSYAFVQACTRLYYDANANQSSKKVALRRGAVTAKEHTLTVIEQMQFDSALEFLEKLGFAIRNYEIKIMDLGEILGLAKDGCIYVSPKCFRLGTKTVAHCLYEEFLHLSEGVGDESREMQNILFETVLTMGERIVGKPL